MGLCSNELIANSAHDGSLALCLESVFSRLIDKGVIKDEEEMINLPIVHTGRKLWDELHQQLSIQPENSFDSFFKLPVHKLQHKLSYLIHEDLSKVIFAEADARTIARIQSAGGKGSLGFLVNCPTDEFNKFSNTQRWKFL